MKKKIEKNEELENSGLVTSGTTTPSELAKLVTLWQQLKDLGVNSISDLEVKIARLQ